MPIDSKKLLKKQTNRTYLAKDRDSFLAEQINFAKTFFPDRIKDFSEASIGGMFLDLSSMIGDNLSFYLDHAFKELDIETAVEPKNIQRHIRSAGVKITGAAPAFAEVSFTIKIPAVKVGTRFEPKPEPLVKILEGTVAQADNGVKFELVEELDFSKKDRAGNFVADISIESANTDGSPAFFFMTRKGICVSGFAENETFTIENNHVPFRTLTLSSENITEVASVVDSDGNQYYEVESLAQDTVFRGIPNINSDNELVEENLEIIPAPYRFTKETDFNTKLTTLTFGSGQAETLDNDIVPDPSQFAIPLFGKKTFPRFALDPGNLLDTQTLGISPKNTILTINYRHGGGLDHNVASNAITDIDTLLLRFVGAPTVSDANTVRTSVSVFNEERASGGEDPPTLTELKEKASSFRSSQNRVVSKEDLLARIYTMPSSFGRVFRAGIRSNPNNPLASQIFIISRDPDQKLIASPDSLKKNLVKYLNEFRLLADAIDILDAQVVNLSINFVVSAEPTANRNLLVFNLIAKLKDYFDIKNWNIDQPIMISDVENLIYNTNGVMGVLGISFKNVAGNVLGRQYSNNTFNVDANTKKGMVVPPPGAIIEIRHADVDLKGSVI